MRGRTGDARLIFCSARSTSPSSSPALCPTGSHKRPRSTGTLAGSDWGSPRSAFGVALCVVRWFEFTALNVRWDDGAYGSTVWVLLGLHTFNLVTDVADTFVLTAVTYAKPLEGKRFVDIAENCGYWYFVVLTWLPIYAVIYFGARV